MQNLSNVQIEELHDDIERYLTLEQSKTNIEFWTVRAQASLTIRVLTGNAEHDGHLQRST